MVQFENIDEIDRAIIELLTENGRMSFADLGRKVNLSRTAVRERVNSLVERGIIEKFTISINPYRIGREMAVFFEIDVEPRRLQEVAERLAQNDDVLSVNQMSGPSTLHVHAALRDRGHLEKFLAETIYALEGITSVRSYVLIRGFKTKSGGLRIG